MKKLMFAVIAAIACFGAGPIAAANAGCNGISGSSVYLGGPDRMFQTHHSIDCTTNNGNYQLRMYAQANNGGWHTVTPAVVRDYPHPANGFGQAVWPNWSCDYLFPEATQVRAKTVIENTDTHQVESTTGTPLTIPVTCTS